MTFTCIEIFKMEAYMKQKKRLFITGIIGVIITLVCYFYPGEIFFDAVGLGAFTGYLYFILLSAFFLFACLTIYAYSKQ
jgi:uncharacterized membrane protein HdeD (DUF308 family)